MVFIYITCKDRKEAKMISKHLLIKRLAACTNIFPIDSEYWWKGKIAYGKEYAIFAKTIAKNFDKIKKEVKKIHSYKVPCICMINSKDSEDYNRWILQETTT